jgi:hypothetical protein
MLALGPKETLAFTARADCYEPLDAEQRLFRKVR